MPSKVLFLQLPRLDNDLSGAREELRLAQVYLRNAVKKSSEQKHFKCFFLRDGDYSLDDAHLIGRIVARRPDIIAATLYLWNIERTLDVLKRLRSFLPRLKIIVGGPEVSRYHPFLFLSRAAAVVVRGEGEIVFPEILKALRLGKRTDFKNVAWKSGEKYVWGSRQANEVELIENLPLANCRYYRPDANGMAYLETMRGCPRRCIYCRYGQERRKMSCLTAGEVLARVAKLRQKGAREIRFIDPSFNSNKHFDEIICALAKWRQKLKIRFFAELNGEILADRQIKLLAAAGFREVEIGVQTCDAKTLRLIRRPARITRIETAIKNLLAKKIKVTVDIMCGLPGQKTGEVLKSVKWAMSLKGARVQCMHTLALPGAELQRNAKKWKIQADNMPPYLVTSTPATPAAKLRALVPQIGGITGTKGECPTTRFVVRSGVVAGGVCPELVEGAVAPRSGPNLTYRNFPPEADPPSVDNVVLEPSPGGRRPPFRQQADPPRRTRMSRWAGRSARGGCRRPNLKALFPEQYNLRLPLKSSEIPGQSARRALIFCGDDLFTFREQIAAMIHKAVAGEKHILWQFVLAPDREEPLDLIDFLAAELRKNPEHVNNRWIRLETGGRLAARRLFVLLRRNRQYDGGWIKATEGLLRKNFY